MVPDLSRSTSSAERRVYYGTASFSTGLLRPVRKYHENMEYIHLNPVKRGLVKEAADWKRSSIHDYTGTVRQPTGYKRRVAARPDSIPADEPDLKVSGVAL
jgi:hypothetical protein